MSDLALFLKKNKKVRPNAQYAATKSLLDASGAPVKWEIRPLTTAEDEEIREACTYDAPVPGKKGQYRTKVDISAYMNRQMCAAIVWPDLNNAELQDSYEVKTPEDLLKALVDDPGEYADLRSFIQELSGFDADMGAEVEEAKN